MGAFDDVEASRTHSSAFNMLGRGIGEVRRKTLLLLVLLGGFLILSLLAIRRQDRIKDIIQDQKHQWTNITPPQTSPIVTPAEPSTEEQWGGAVAPKKPSRPQEKTKTPTSEKEPVAPGPRFGDRSLSDASLIDLRNETLGFGQVYVLNVPGRTDKSDAMRLTASLTGFDFEIIEGVMGKDVPAKALSGVRPPSTMIAGRGHG
ncbi:MAG: hypothetical protein Q9163_002241 [Psora crenata]